jgi:fatty acid desaturase
VAWLTTHTAVTRIRFIAEHGMTPDQGDPLRNTRTVLPSWWERLLIVPNRLNFHLEHHLLMTVPHYNLARLHRLLRDRGRSITPASSASISRSCRAPAAAPRRRRATRRVARSP